MYKKEDSKDLFGFLKNFSEVKYPQVFNLSIDFLTVVIAEKWRQKNSPPFKTIIKACKNTNDGYFFYLLAKGLEDSRQVEVSRINKLYLIAIHNGFYDSFLLKKIILYLISNNKIVKN